MTGEFQKVALSVPFPCLASTETLPMLSTLLWLLRCCRQLSILRGSSAVSRSVHIYECYLCFFISFLRKLSREF